MVLRRVGCLTEPGIVCWIVAPCPFRVFRTARNDSTLRGRRRSSSGPQGHGDNGPLNEILFQVLLSGFPNNVLSASRSVVVMVLRFVGCLTEPGIVCWIVAPCPFRVFRIARNDSTLRGRWRSSGGPQGHGDNGPLDRN